MTELYPNVKFEVIFFSMIHDKPKFWNTTLITKGVITLYNYSFYNLYVTVLSQLLHLIIISYAYNFLLFQGIIQNIWNTQ